MESEKKELKYQLEQFKTLFRFVEKNEDFCHVIQNELKNNIVDINELKSLNLYESDYNKNIINFVKNI